MALFCLKTTVWVGEMTDRQTSGQDKTRQDKTRQDKTRQDKTRQDKTRQTVFMDKCAHRSDGSSWLFSYLKKEQNMRSLTTKTTRKKSSTKKKKKKQERMPHRSIQKNKKQKTKNKR